MRDISTTLWSPKYLPFEKPDLLLNKNYTVTRLEVAFLMIVSCERLWRTVIFKGTALPTGLNVKLGGYVFICTYLRQWMVIWCWLLTTVNLSLQHLTSPERRSFFLSSVCYERKNWYMKLFYFSDTTEANMRFIVCSKLMTAFTVCESTKELRHWTKCKTAVIIKLFIATIFLEQSNMLHLTLQENGIEKKMYLDCN